jgi:hypothetical protein
MIAGSILRLSIPTTAKPLQPMPAQPALRRNS